MYNNDTSDIELELRQNDPLSDFPKLLFCVKSFVLFLFIFISFIKYSIESNRLIFNDIESKYICSTWNWQGIYDNSESRFDFGMWN